MHFGYGFISEHLLQDREGVVIDEAHIPQAAFGHAVTDNSMVVQGLLDAEEVHARLLGSRGDEEAAFARADFDDHRLAVPEELVEIKSGEAAFFWIDHDFLDGAHGYPL